jgi:glyoxylase-like metal-dependent hydrolase (beta-lactamase superfamily II)
MSPTAVASPPVAKPCGALQVVAFAHPQGCRAYLLVDPTSGQAMAIDPHLDGVQEIAASVRAHGWTLPYVVDTHTHADHPSGSAALATACSSTRIAHRDAHHRGVSRHPEDGETLHLGDVAVTVRHAPGHTPDHVVLLAPGALFSGDTLLIGSVARTDFLGGDAGTLHASLARVLAGLPDSTVLHPGHDYQGRTESTLGAERASNPWLAIRDRAEFVRRLTANAPKPPANMDALLRMNRENAPVPERIPATEAVERVQAGGAASLIDVRSGVEVDAEHVPGSRHVPLESVAARVDEIRTTPAPRMLLCRTGRRAQSAQRTLAGLGVGALSVVDGGLEAFRAAAGPTVQGKARMSLERQVRVVAGSLVLVGAILSLLVDRAFVGIPIFVGSGLVFSGITDWCGMGLLLARMPWNRRSGGITPAGAGGGGCAASAPGGCSADAAPAGGCAAGLPPDAPS